LNLQNNDTPEIKHGNGEINKNHLLMGIKMGKSSNKLNLVIFQQTKFDY